MRRLLPLLLLSVPVLADPAVVFNAAGTARLYASLNFPNESDALTVSGHTVFKVAELPATTNLVLDAQDPRGWRLMTPQEIADRDAAAEAARQANKSPTQKAVENGYLEVCQQELGFTGKPTPLQLYAKLLADLDAAQTVPELKAVIKPSLKLMFRVLQLHALGVDTEDIPEEPHE